MGQKEADGKSLMISSQDCLDVFKTLVISKFFSLSTNIRDNVKPESTFYRHRVHQNQENSIIPEKGKRKKNEKAETVPVLSLALPQDGG